jgi:hypothetical protein
MNQFLTKSSASFQQPPYKTDESWLETNLLPHIKNSDRNPVFISTAEDLYDEHIRVYGLDVEID